MCGHLCYSICVQISPLAPFLAPVLAPVLSPPSHFCLFLRLKSMWLTRHFFSNLNINQII